MKDTDIKQLATEIICGFTRFHDILRVRASEHSGNVTVTVDSHADDTPRIIGSQGVMHKSISLILACAGHQIGKKVRMIVEEPVVGSREHPTPFEPDEDWTPDSTIALMRKVCDSMFTNPADVNIRQVGRGYSMVDVTVEHSEAKDARLPREEVEEALSRLFNAIGKNTGHNLRVDLHYIKETKKNDSVSNPRRADEIPS